MRTKEKRKTHIFRNGVVMALMVGLFALMSFFGFGPGQGFGEGSGEGEQEQTAIAAPEKNLPPAETEAEEEPTPEPSEPSELFGLSDLPTPPGQAAVVIRVIGDSVQADGQGMEDTEALKAYLEAIHADGAQYLLLDAHAYQNTYLEVQRLLEELSLEYAEGREG